MTWTDLVARDSRWWVERSTLKPFWPAQRPTLPLKPFWPAQRPTLTFGTPPRSTLLKLLNLSVRCARRRLDFLNRPQATH
eukprot:1394827-Prymnesium_polylepis.1